MIQSNLTPARWVTTLALALLAGCSSSPSAQPSTVSTATSAASPAPVTTLGDFPERPRGALPEPVAAQLQAVLDEKVAKGEIRGATAAVIIAGSGTWTGASGTDLEGTSLTAQTPLTPASTFKTVIAAQVLRLVEEGILELDDPAVEHLPAGLPPFDDNGATIRHLLGHRSGLTDTPETDQRGTSLAERVAAMPPPDSPAGSTITYANVNYELLVAIIANATGQPEETVFEAGVLAGPDREGLRAPEGVRAMALARWGYDLYGGYVLSDASLTEMTDFNGDWYGLGAIDLAHPTTQYGYDPPAIGHGGQSSGSMVVRLVAFPDTGVVIAVQAIADGFRQIQPLVVSMRGIAQAALEPAQ